MTRIMARAQTSGRADDNEETAKKRLKTFHDQTEPVVEYYQPIGRLCRIDANGDKAGINATARRNFFCKFSYLLGPPGCQLPGVADSLEQRYGYQHINVGLLLSQYAQSSAKDAKQVAEALKKGKPVEASIVCPLVLEEVRKAQRGG